MARFLKYGLYVWVVCYLAIAYTFALKTIFPAPSVSLAFFGVAMPVEAGFYMLLASISLVLSALFEVLPSKNNLGYKALWAVAVFLLSEIGVAAYYFIGRKNLVDEEIGKRKR